jgi:hypothetical protein
VNLEDRTKVGRWLDHASAMARTCERNLAAGRVVEALVDHSPELAWVAFSAVMAGES